MNIYIHAPNVHQGGGLVLIRELIHNLPPNTYLTLDERLPINVEDLDKYNINRVSSNLWGRAVAELYLWRNVKHGDFVLCFGNLPPLFKLKGLTSVFLQNRYLVDTVKLTSYPIKLRIRLQIERMWFQVMRKHASRYVVQSVTMRNILRKRYAVNSIVLPFIQTSININEPNKSYNFEKSCDFLYVASGEPHKNHKNLIIAWNILADQNLYPKLHLTLDEQRFPDLVGWIESEKCKHNLDINNLGYVPSSKMIETYMQAKALIYPSTLESFGLPLLEAKKAGISVIASELDYVRDIIDPDEVFNPDSPKSISRAVKRFMGYEEEKVPILDAKAFINKLIES